jgi:hypothetical protein
MAATGHPAPFGLGAPAYLIALGGWLVAALWLLGSASELTGLALSSRGPVLAAHALGLVFFPFAVAAAVWQLLPVMLRNDPPRTGHRWLVLVLLFAGAPLAIAVDTGLGWLGAVSATLLALGLALLVAELALLVYRAPRGRLLVVSRLAVGLAAVNAVAAFVLGAMAFADGGPEPAGVPFERFLLVHLSLAVLGWLTVLILAVGRTLVPMLAASAAAPVRRVPVPEVVFVGGLWVYAAGIAESVDAVAALGILVMAATLAVPARRFVGSAFVGKFGSEGPAAHVVVGLVFLVQATVVALAALSGVGDGRRAAAACVLLVGIGWATGVVLGHLGKLVSLSGWGSWPPGPRPKQADLYPRRGWQVELVLFGVGVELLALGVLASSTSTTRMGGALLVAAALVALLCGAETVRRVVVGRASGGLGLASR